MEFSKLFPFWDELTKEEKDLIERESFTENVKKGDVISSPTKDCKGIISVLSGSLRVYVISKEGREVNIFTVSKNELCVLSASGLMKQITFDVFVEASEATSLCVIPPSTMKSIMHSNVKVDLYIHKNIGEILSKVMVTFQDILFKTVDSRVAALLLLEGKKNGTMTVEMTHEDIAKSIGSSREVVTKVLKSFSKEEMIESKRSKISIIDKEKLKKLL